LPDQIEYLLLPCGEFGHGATVCMNRLLYFYTVSCGFQAKRCDPAAKPPSAAFSIFSYKKMKIHSFRS
jgi:hypothetical protein